MQNKVVAAIPGGVLLRPLTWKISYGIITRARERQGGQLMGCSPLPDKPVIGEPV